MAEGLQELKRLFPDFHEPVIVEVYDRTGRDLSRARDELRAMQEAEGSDSDEEEDGGTNKLQGPRPAQPPPPPPPPSAPAAPKQAQQASTSSPAPPPQDAVEAEREARATRMAEDAVSFAKRGSKITKYIFHGGAPHQRFMTISDDRLRLRWGNNERKLKGSLELASIYTVLPGVQTPAFKNTAGFVDSPTMNDTCFSVVTEDRTLDVDVGDKPTRDKWVIALLYLRFGIRLIISLKGYSGGNRRVKVPSSAVEEAQRLVRRQSQAEAAAAAAGAGSSGSNTNSLRAANAPRSPSTPGVNGGASSASGSNSPGRTGWGAVQAQAASPSATGASSSRARFGSMASVTAAAGGQSPKPMDRLRSGTSGGGASPSSLRDSPASDLVSSGHHPTSSQPSSPLEPRAPGSVTSPTRRDGALLIAEAGSPVDKDKFAPLADAEALEVPEEPPIDLDAIRAEVAKYHDRNKHLKEEISLLTPRVEEANSEAARLQEQQRHFAKQVREQSERLAALMREKELYAGENEGSKRAMQKKMDAEKVQLENDLRRQLANAEESLDNGEQANAAAVAAARREVERNRDECRMEVQGEAANYKHIIDTFDMEALRLSLQAELDSINESIRTLDGRYVDMGRQIQEMEGKTAENLAVIDDLNRKHTQGAIVCRQLRFEIHDLQGKYPVFARVRPVLDEEDPTNQAVTFPENMPHALCIRNDKKGESNTFEFDMCFQPTMSQRECFEEIMPLVYMALDGKQASLLMFGPSGSGKTFSLEGGPPLPEEAAPISPTDLKAMVDRDPTGFIVRTVERLHSLFPERPSAQYKLELSAVAVENETLFDLLADSGAAAPELEVIEDEEVFAYWMVAGAARLPMRARADAEAAVTRVQQCRDRLAAEKKLDPQKCHVLWDLRIETLYPESGRFSVGRMMFADMVGSEFHDENGLGSFADVVASLANGVPITQIPYEQSKFTQLLQSTIGGRSLVMVTLAPVNVRWHVSHNISALRFAARVNTCDIGSAQARKAAVKSAAEKLKQQAGGSALRRPSASGSTAKWGLDYT